jgi:ubiquinone/menaquinone biosynthesis methyltransferase
MFSRISHGYDRANRLMSLGTDVRWRRQAVANMLPPVPEQEATILDLCAGTLDSTMEIHRQYPAARVIGGDFSAGMLAEGRTKLVGPAAERVEAMEMDAHDLPLPEQSVDAIFCAFGVRNLSDLEKATREQGRALKPGGRLTVLEFFRPSGVVTRTVHELYNRTVLPIVGWAATGNLDAYLYLPRSIGQFARIEEYGELLRSVGFTDVETERLTMGVAWIVRATWPGGAQA